MSQPDKISNFPIPIDKRLSLSELAGPSDGLVNGVDPTREIRVLIDQLQAAVREAQERQRMAEGERDQTQDELDRLRADSGAIKAAEQKIVTLQHEREGLGEQLKAYGEMVVELKGQLELAERKRTDAGKQRDDAMKLFAEAQQTAERTIESRDDALRQLSVASRQRDSAIRERDDTGRSVTKLQVLLAEAQKELAAERAGKKGNAAMEKQIAALKQARDAASAQAMQFKATIGELQDQLSVAGYERDDARMELEKARKAAKAGETARETQAAAAADLKKRSVTLKKRNRALMDKARAISAELKALKIEAVRSEENAGDLRRQLAEAQSAREIAGGESEAMARSLADVSKQRDEYLSELESARTSLAGAKDQLESNSREKAETEKRFEDSISRMQEELSVLKNGQDCAIPDAKLAGEHEKRRVQMIELSAQLETAQHQIRELSASLAEARLEARANRASAKTAGARVAPAAGTDSEVARSVIATLRRSFERLLVSPTDLETLQDLQKHARFLADAAVTAGQRAVHRISVSLFVLLKSLAGIPEQASVVIETIGNTIELLADLLDTRDADRRVKFDKTSAFIVDDDEEACRVISEALSMAGVHSRTSRNAASAISELANSRFDLVLLDVFLPDLNGFDLCSHIRTMDLHAGTPVMFLSGDPSPENRREAAERGGSDFIAKPMHPEELALRALSGIARAQLRIA